MTYNSIDIDKGDREAFVEIYMKIQNCKQHGAVNFKDTLKGYHIMMICNIVCDLCRFVFDDPRRYAMDFRRPVEKQNVLFEPFSGRRLLNVSK